MSVARGKSFGRYGRSAHLSRGGSMTPRPPHVRPRQHRRRISSNCGKVTGISRQLPNAPRKFCAKERT